MSSTPRIRTTGTRLDEIERRLRMQERSSRLNSASISEGGLRIKDGGSLDLEGGGRIRVWDGGSVDVVGGDIRLWDGSGMSIVGALGQYEGGTAFVMQTPQYAYFRAAERVNGTTYIEMRSDELDLSSRVSGINIFGAGGVVIRSSGNQLQLGLDASDVFIGHGTTSLAANARLEPTGHLSRSTSSRKYKDQIRDAEVDPSAVLQIQGRTWRDRAQAEEDPDTEARHIGFIAEELHDLGLTQFVEYDAEGLPDAIQYDRLTVALLAVAKSQDARLAALETALAATLESDERNAPNV